MLEAKKISELSNSEVNERLARQLERQAASGVVDIKVHVEVTDSTRPSDTMRALLHVLEQEEKGEIESVPLSRFRDFDGLYSWLTCS